jgi:hypothetical protein
MTDFAGCRVFSGGRKDSCRQVDAEVRVKIQREKRLAPHWTSVGERLAHVDERRPVLNGTVPGV